jgi:predicted nucleotidyltransferase
MPTETDPFARSTPRPEAGMEAAVVDFGRSAAEVWADVLGDRLLSVDFIGSLAHGGFSPRYSDIDVALVFQEPVDHQILASVQAEAAALSAAFAAKLSIFWTDRRFSDGRFPILDRIDYLDHRTALLESERILPPRPSLEEIRCYLRGAPFMNWATTAKRFASSDVFDPKDQKAYLRALLYPARFAYSWTTGRIAGNDAAVTYMIERNPAGFDLALINRAILCRNAGLDPDSLFADRAILLKQVEACAQLMSRSP